MQLRSHCWMVLWLLYTPTQLPMTHVRRLCRTLSRAGVCSSDPRCTKTVLLSHQVMSESFAVTCQFLVRKLISLDALVASTNAGGEDRRDGQTKPAQGAVLRTSIASEAQRATAAVKQASAVMEMVAELILLEQRLAEAMSLNGARSQGRAALLQSRLPCFRTDFKTEVR